jgi:hypothetical protein
LLTLPPPRRNMSLDRNSPSMLGKVVKFGHPWHGLARNGTITLPNGQQMPYRQPSGGGARVYQVPGVSAEPQTPEDESAGINWLPYAIVSGGFDGQIYTQRLPLDGWLYADPQGRTWMVTVSFAGSSVTVAAVEGQQATVTLRRFGLIGEQGDTYVYPVAMPADMGQNTPEVYNPASSSLVFLTKSNIQIRFFDAAPDGSRASFRLSVAVGTSVRATQWAWRPCGWIELSITGPGDAASVAVGVIATRAQTVGPHDNIQTGGYVELWESVDTSVTVTGDNPPTCSGTWTENYSTQLNDGPLPFGIWRAVLVQQSGFVQGNGTLTSDRRRSHIVAINYDEQNERRVIECIVSSQRTTTKTLSMSVSNEAERVYSMAPFNGACIRDRLISNSPRQATVLFEQIDESRFVLELRDNGVLFDSYDTGPCLSTLNQTWNRGDGSSMTLASQTVNVTFKQDAIINGPMVVGFSFTGGSQEQSLRYALIEMERRLQLAGTNLSDLSWYAAPCVYSPRAIGLCLHRRDRRGSSTISTRYTTVEDNTITAPTAYATRHPVTNEVALDSVPVCWV